MNKTLLCQLITQTQENDKNMLKIRQKIQNFDPESCAIKTDSKIFIFVTPRIIR